MIKSSLEIMGASMLNSTTRYGGNLRFIQDYDFAMNIVCNIFCIALEIMVVTAIIYMYMIMKAAKEYEDKHNNHIRGTLNV